MAQIAPDHHAARGSPVDGLRSRVLQFAVVFIAALVTVLAGVYWMRYQAAVDNAERSGATLAHILARHIERTVGAADAALRQITTQNRRLGGPESGAGEWPALLAAAHASLSGVGSLTIVDSAGIIRHSTVRAILGQSRAENFLVRSLRDSRSTGLVADTPFRSLVTGEMLMPVGRRLDDAAGTFQGAAVATIELALLREFYRSVAREAGAVVRVLHPSGVVFFSEPSSANPVGASAAGDPVLDAYGRGTRAGTVVAPLAREGAAYISAFRTTDEPGLIVVVSLERAAVLAPWREELALGAAITALLSAGLLFAAHQMRRELAARHSAERALGRREREMAVAQSVAGLGSFAIDIATNKIRLSPQFNRIVGWPPARETAVLDDFLSLADERDRPRLREILRRCGSEGGSYRTEFAMRRGDGPPRVFWTEGFWHEGEAGRPEIFAFCQDVTERRSIEEQLLQSQKMDAVGQLTGGVAHDFNNLLTVILGSADLLSEQMARDPNSARLLENVLGAAQRGADLTQRLLAFARRQPLEPQSIDVNRLLAGIETMLRRTLGEHIEIEYVRGAGLWAALADRPQLETAILNLAINARDAMPEGGRLTIETANAHIDQDYAGAHAEVSPGQYVMIAVADTGVGMPADVAARAFEPFFTTKPAGKGTGLGLSMIYGFVKQSGGHVKIYSEQGSGTTVKLYLPRALAGAEPDRRQGEPAARGRGERILAVEDDDAVRAFAERQLSELGYAVSAVSSGPAALAALQSGQHFDLLFTDIVMPGGMNGRELADAALKLRPDLKVLFTSGYTENAVIHHGHLDPGVTLLQKPYRRETLAAKVRAVLAGSGRSAK